VHATPTLPPANQRVDRVDLLIGTLLRTGVITAASLVVLGGVIFLARVGLHPADYHTFHGEPSQYRTLGGIIGGTIALDGRSIIQLGALILIATPVARVALALVAFAQERDTAYVMISGLVLALLLASLIGGAALAH
jgi:uncharacterized membrane protein